MGLEEGALAAGLGELFGGAAAAEVPAGAMTVVGAGGELASSTAALQALGSSAVIPGSALDVAISGGAAAGAAGAAGAFGGAPPSGEPLTASGGVDIGNAIAGSPAEQAMGGFGFAQPMTAAAGGFDWGALTSGIKQAAGIAGPALSMTSGLVGLDQAARQRALQQRALASLSGQQATSEAANARVQALINNPAALASDPAFKLAQQAAARATADVGGGASAVAAATASQDWLARALGTTAPLIGAPSYGTAAGIGSDATGMLSRALASLGYGATQLSGGSTAFTPAQMQNIIQAMSRFGVLGNA